MHVINRRDPAWWSGNLGAEPGAEGGISSIQDELNRRYEEHLDEMLHEFWLEGVREREALDEKLLPFPVQTTFKEDK